MKPAFLFLATIFSSVFINAQTTEEEQVTSIRKEYQKIVLDKQNFVKKEAYYTVDEAYWMNTNYTGYLDAEGKLVLLTFSVGEEGYWSDVEYYFKDNKVFFIFIRSGDPEENEEENRIYFWDNEIIRALVKRKKSTDKIDFSQITNQPNKYILDDISVQTKNYLQTVESARNQFFEALEN